jgi:hypothetical protein
MIAWLLKASDGEPGEIHVAIANLILAQKGIDAVRLIRRFFCRCRKN